ncbi:MAG TPA: hypothetical protein VKE51_30560 [Vicinamibacterales bacterium]|nr:hypothetical protein [Vicinamibacterales bacterium]
MLIFGWSHDRLQAGRTEAVGVLGSKVDERGGVQFHVAAPAAKQSSALEGLTTLRAALLLFEHRDLDCNRPYVDARRGNRSINLSACLVGGSFEEF